MQEESDLLVLFFGKFVKGGAFCLDSLVKALIRCTDMSLWFDKMTVGQKKYVYLLLFGMSLIDASVANETRSDVLNLNNNSINIESIINTPRKNAQFSCTECHGVSGNSVNTDQYEKQPPILAAQDMGYLYDQLINFKNGRRFTAEMADIMSDYSDQELQLIAHYYAAQKRIISPDKDVTRDTLRHNQLEDAYWVKQGEELYSKGDISRGIVACQTCHGEFGEGRIIGLDKAPKLTGQHARYVRMTLDNFARGKRTTDGLFDQPMQTISRKLTDKDRRNLAAYIQMLKHPDNQGAH